MLAGLVIATLLTACQSDDPVEPQVGGATESTSSVQTGAGEEDDDGSTVGDVPLPKDQPNLDLEERHVNGTVLRVTGITFGPTAMTVSVDAVNGFTDAIELNSIDMQLVDNLDNVYNFAPPEDNPELRVESGATLSGTLTFLGRLDRSATSLRLITNEYGTGPVDDTYAQSTSPSVEINDIPVERG